MAFAVYVVVVDRRCEMCSSCVLSLEAGVVVTADGGEGVSMNQSCHALTLKHAFSPIQFIQFI